MNRYRADLLLSFLAGAQSIASPPPSPSFHWVSKGGSDKSNLSSYLVARNGYHQIILRRCRHAATPASGKLSNGVSCRGRPAWCCDDIYSQPILFPTLTCDHVAGLILNSPDDSTKDIYGLPFCLEVLQDKYFSWKSWANFGDEGEKPLLKKYHYVPMVTGEEMAIEKTPLSVTAYALSHGVQYGSTAFLVKNGAACLLYLGDTGADSVEHSDKLHLLWQVAGPLIRQASSKPSLSKYPFPQNNPTNRFSVI